MKNKLTRKLMLSAFTLLFAVISLGASTYAWFVMSEDAKVTAFEGTVTTGESGLEIAVASIEDRDDDAIAALKWRSTQLTIAEDLGWDDLDTADVVESPIVFDAVQNQKGNFATTFKKLNKNGSLTDATANVDYIAFRLYFRLADTTGITNEIVYLTNYDLNTTGETPAWYVNKDYTGTLLTDNLIKVGDKPVYKVSDAARIAFVPEDKNTYATEVFESEGVDESLNTSSYGNKKVGAYDYYNKVKPGVLDTLYENVGENYLTTKQYLDAAKGIGSLGKADNLTYVDVYIWIDGWDNECINAIFSQTLQIALDFSLDADKYVNPRPQN